MLETLKFFFLPSSNQAKKIFEENSNWKKIFICVFLSLLMAIMLFIIIFFYPTIIEGENIVINPVDGSSFLAIISIKDESWKIIFSAGSGAQAIQNILFIIMWTLIFFVASIFFWTFNFLISRVIARWKSSFADNILVGNVWLFWLIFIAFLFWLYVILFLNTTYISSNFLASESFSENILQIFALFLFIWVIVLAVNMLRWAMKVWK